MQKAWCSPQSASAKLGEQGLQALILVNSHTICVCTLVIYTIYTEPVIMHCVDCLSHASLFCRLGQACSHVAALLFTLDDLKRKGTEEIQHDAT